MKAFVTFGLVGLAAAMPRNVVQHKPTTTNFTSPANLTSPTNPSDLPLPPLTSGLPTLTNHTLPAPGPSVPSKNTSSTTPTYFTGNALRSGSEIHNLPIAATGGTLHLGKPRTTHTPAGAATTNSSSPETVFAFSPDASTLALAAAVPGGQSVYVAPDGAVKFTLAHSGDTGGNGTITGFAVVDGALKFEGEDFVAVRAVGAGGDQTYRVYAASRAMQAQGLGFVFYANPAEKGRGVFQYV